MGANEKNLYSTDAWLLYVDIRALFFNSHARVPKIKIQEKSQISFQLVKYWKTNGTMQKYCWRDFIWMVTP